MQETQGCKWHWGLHGRFPTSIFCQEGISRRVRGWSLCLTVVAAKRATRRKTGGEWRRHHLPCSLQNLLHASPVAPPSASPHSHWLLPRSPHWARRCSCFEIIGALSDYIGWGFGRGIQTSPGLTTWMKDVSRSNKDLNKSRPPSRFSRGASLSFQNHKYPLSRLNFAASRRKTNHDLPHCWDGLPLKSPVMQEGVPTLWITFASSPLVIIPLPTS